jgi:hypothetical protein
MRLSPLAPLNRAADATASAYYVLGNAASMPAQSARKINDLAENGSIVCAILVRMTLLMRYPGAIYTIFGGVT